MKPFRERCYDAARKIPAGRVTTYKEIALYLGTCAYRAVGTAMKKNPYSKVPCHRVVNSNGIAGGYSRGKEEKIRLLKKEGIEISGEKILNFKKVLFRF